MIINFDGGFDAGSGVAQVFDMDTGATTEVAPGPPGSVSTQQTNYFGD
jgi:hypothetical protein